MSLDEFIDEKLDRETGGEEDPGGEGDNTQHGGGKTFPDKVETLQEDYDETSDQDVGASPELELTEVICPGEEGKGDCEKVEGGEGHVGVSDEADV